MTAFLTLVLEETPEGDLNTWDITTMIKEERAAVISGNDCDAPLISEPLTMADAAELAGAGGVLRVLAVAPQRCLVWPDEENEELDLFDVLHRLALLEGEPVSPECRVVGVAPDDQGVIMEYHTRLVDSDPEDEDEDEDEDD